MRRFLIQLVAAGLLATPVHTPDGQLLPLTDPGLGREVIACSSCVYRIYFEDLLGGGDRDYNDQVFEVTFGDVPDGILATRSLRSQTAFTGSLVRLSYAILPGRSVTLGLRVHTVNEPWVKQADSLIFYTGAGSRNTDGQIHAAVYCVQGACRP